jgi:hypothetical protein
LTATNLIEFFKVLPKEEQKNFMVLAEKITTPIIPKRGNKHSVPLTKEQALQYLLSSTFKLKNS